MWVLNLLSNIRTEKLEFETEILWPASVKLSAPKSPHPTPVGQPPKQTHVTWSRQI